MVVNVDVFATAWQTGKTIVIKTNNVRGIFIENGSCICYFGEKIGHIIMLREDSINICSQFDYTMAEMLLDRRTVSDYEDSIEQL